MMRISVHPIFLLLLIVIAMSGEIALYSIIFMSLLLHEAGHIVAARLVGVKVERCVILPYGGEITLKNEHLLSSQQLCWIALGGPIATVVGIGSGYLLPSMIGEPFIHVQYLLLAVNMLPVWPLDGGKILCHSLLTLYPKTKIYETFLSLSLCFLTIIVLGTLLMLPDSISLVVISLFLLSKGIGEWRIRKYRSAFEKVVMNRLT